MDLGHRVSQFRQYSAFFTVLYGFLGFKTEKNLKS